jgi:phosphoglycerol transferase MdoB-like AlkP superfamily enzyme
MAMIDKNRDQNQTPVRDKGRIMILEHMGHISIATEIAYIAFYLGALFNIPFPKGVNVGLGIYNFIYASYVCLVILYKNKLCRNLGVIILVLALFKDLLWSQNAIMCIIDSLICICLLLLINKVDKAEEISAN